MKLFVIRNTDTRVEASDKAFQFLERKSILGGGGMDVALLLLHNYFSFSAFAPFLYCTALVAVLFNVLLLTLQLFAR